MQIAAINKQISVAMAGSVVGHLVLLFGLLWIVAQRLEPAESSWVLDLTLRFENADKATVARTTPVQATANREKLGPARSIERDRQQARRPPVAKPPSAARMTMLVPAAEPAEQAGNAFAGEPTETRRERSSKDIAQTAMAQEPSLEPSSGGPVLTVRQDAPEDLPAHDLLAVSALAKRPLLPHQKKMLERKFKRWTEKFHQADGRVSHATWQHKGQAYSAEFHRKPAHGDMDIEWVTVEIRTEQDGVMLSSTMQMKRLAFSSFAQFVNRWDSRVQLHSDELDGRFHSNSNIVLAYDRDVMPTFHGKVTTTSRRVDFADFRGYARRARIFKGGLETGVRRIALPEQFLSLPGEGRPAKDQVHVFEHDTQLTFYADGTYGWRASETEAPEQQRSMPQSTLYLIGSPGTQLRVKGVVAGQVLVYSPERIIIDGDLTYAHAPGTLPEAGDFLGLVSDRYVDVAPPEVTGPGDLRIHAAIHAGRRFEIKGFKAKTHAMLYVFGSLSAGTLSATEPRFSTKIVYDRRFEKQRPPGFPMTDRYEVAAWDGAWTTTLAAAQNQ